MGGFLTGAERLRFLLPDALLVRGDRLEERVGVWVDDGCRVRALGAARDAPPALCERFAGEIWTAAPVLAHAHLDGWDAPAQDFRRAPFADWVRDLLAWRTDPRRMTPGESAAAALHELDRNGCGAVAVHAAEPGAEGGAPGPAIVAWREVLEPATPDAGAAWRRWTESCAPCEALALHAPFTVDLGLAREVFARQRGVVSLHLGESDEERRCLAAGDGPLADLLEERRGRRPPGGFASPMAWLSAAGGLRPGTLAVHGGALEEEELRALRRAGVALAFCPGTHLWFGRPAPAFSDAGVMPDALGCDSRASNETLDPLREFRLALRVLPDWPRAAAWRALTEGGARAIGRPDLSGFARGAPLRALRVADPRAEHRLRGAGDARDRAESLLEWLGTCEDPRLAPDRIPSFADA